MLKKGDTVPTFETTNQEGQAFELTYDRPTVVYFYPKDDTPGCTTEAEQFQRERETYEDAGVDVYGISTDSVESHKGFADKYQLDFDLLADPAGEIAEEFGVPVEQGTADRVTFVILDGKIYNVYENVSPDGHARKVLMDLLDEGIVELG